MNPKVFSVSAVCLSDFFSQEEGELEDGFRYDISNLYSYGDCSLSLVGVYSFIKDLERKPDSERMIICRNRISDFLLKNPHVEFVSL